MKNLFLSANFMLLLCLACTQDTKPAQNQVAATSTVEATAGKNYLSMKVNGVEWKADNEIFGAFHPKGYNKAIIIAGLKGKKGQNEQICNLNLYNTYGPNTYTFADGNPDYNVAQFMNIAPGNDICGSGMGFKMKAIVTKASGLPNEIEATFEGEMTCGNNEVLKITEGKFYFHE